MPEWVKKMQVILLFELFVWAVVAVITVLVHLWKIFLQYLWYKLLDKQALRMSKYDMQKKSIPSKEE